MRRVNSTRIPKPQADRPAIAGSRAARGRCVVIAAALLIAGMCCFAAQAPTSSSQQVVVIKQMHFDPSTLNVKAGDTVEWKNEDIFSHTVTANDGSFDSGLIAPGSSWRTTIRKTGSIAYHCRPHPNMAAELIAQQGAAHGQHEHGGTQDEEHGQGSLRWSPPKKPDEIHPILVNFTAALLPLALLSDLLGRLFRRPGLHAAGAWIMVYEAAITPLTVLAGWWWKSAQPNQLPAKLITVHQWLGTGAALLFIVLAAWRWRFHNRAVPPSWTYLAVALVALVALIYQGSLGGAMVFGQ
ncbi:MAG TPA: DUF2231 domain-containing protein [Acidobacteriaceae bacterium]|nr:DUF2231 domain-containing protein [Acidobacteriaceae bacterium]